MPTIPLVISTTHRGKKGPYLKMHSQVYGTHIKLFRTFIFYLMTIMGLTHILRFAPDIDIITMSRLKQDESNNSESGATHTSLLEIRSASTF